MCKRIGVVPTARLFENDDPYQDNYVFVNGYLKRIAQAGGAPIGMLAVDGEIAPGALDACDALLICGGRKIWPYHIQAAEHAVLTGKPVLGVCLGMQVLCAYYMIREEAARRGLCGSAAQLFETLKREKFFFTRPVAHHWDTPLTRENIEAVKHPVTLAPGSRLATLLRGETTRGASMHRYRADHVPQGLSLCAWTDDGCIEGVEAGTNVLGVQFHPEVDGAHAALFEALVRGRF